MKPSILDLKYEAGFLEKNIESCDTENIFCPGTKNVVDYHLSFPINKDIQIYRYTREFLLSSHIISKIIAAPIFEKTMKSYRYAISIDCSALKKVSIEQIVFYFA